MAGGYEVNVRRFARALNCTLVTTAKRNVASGLDLGGKSVRPLDLPPFTSLGCGLSRDRSRDPPSK
jgi:hypothetical protein